MNVSLPLAQERFVRSQVTTGRYRTASEVIRDGLRLLEEAEHRRLVEKWIYEDLSAEGHAALPEEVKARVQAFFENLVGQAVEDVKAGRVVDGPSAIKRLQEELEARRPKHRAGWDRFFADPALALPDDFETSDLPVQERDPI